MQTLFRLNWRARQAIRLRNLPKLSVLRKHPTCVALHVRHGDVLLPKYYMHDHRASFNMSLEEYVSEAVEISQRWLLVSRQPKTKRTVAFLMTDDADISNSVDRVTAANPRIRIHQARTARPLPSLSSLQEKKLNDFNYLTDLDKGPAHSELLSYFEGFELAAACPIWVGNCRSSFAVFMITYMALRRRQKKPLILSDFGRGGSCSSLAKNTNGILRRHCRSGDNPCAAMKNTEPHQCDAGAGPQVCSYL